jgi:hypothetical protein
MSSQDHSHHSAAHEEDVIESIVPLMPVILPIGGGILIFLLAFIAVFMA